MELFCAYIVLSLVVAAQPALFFAAFGSVRFGIAVFVGVAILWPALMVVGGVCELSYRITGRPQVWGKSLL